MSPPPPKHGSKRRGGGGHKSASDVGGGGGKDDPILSPIEAAFRAAAKMHFRRRWRRILAARALQAGGAKLATATAAFYQNWPSTSRRVAHRTSWIINCRVLVCACWVGLCVQSKTCRESGRTAPTWEQAPLAALVSALDCKIRLEAFYRRRACRRCCLHHKY